MLTGDVEQGPKCPAYSQAELGCDTSFLTCHLCFPHMLWEATGVKGAGKGQQGPEKPSTHTGSRAAYSEVGPSAHMGPRAAYSEEGPGSYMGSRAAYLEVGPKAHMGSRVAYLEVGRGDHLGSRATYMGSRVAYLKAETQRSYGL